MRVSWAEEIVVVQGNKTQVSWNVAKSVALTF